MLIKKVELLKIESVIGKYSKIKNYTFAHALFINYSKIKTEVDAINENIKPSDEFNAYLKEMEVNGNIITCAHCGKENRISNKELQAKYNTVILDRIKNVNECEKDLDTFINIDFEVVDMKYIEENMKDHVNFEFLNDLSFMIKIN